MLRNRKFRRRRGQALVEYALIIATVMLTAVVAVAVFGHKVADMIAVMAGVLPGANAADNAPITTEGVMPTQLHHGNIELNAAGMVANGGVERYGSVFGHAGAAAFVAGDGTGHDD